MCKVHRGSAGSAARHADAEDDPARPFVAPDSKSGIHGVQQYVEQKGFKGMRLCVQAGIVQQAAQNEQWWHCPEQQRGTVANTRQVCPVHQRGSVAQQQNKVVVSGGGTRAVLFAGQM